VTRRGQTFACDVAIIGIGIVPNVELAAAGHRATTASSSTSTPHGGPTSSPPAITNHPLCSAAVRRNP
jgi:hypothetical protein